MSCKETAITTIHFNGLSIRQAAKWFLLHELLRHETDIAAIRADLEKLADVELPADLQELAGHIRFEV